MVQHTLAATTAATSTAPCFFSTRAAVLSVVPVVMTSSTSRPSSARGCPYAAVQRGKPRAGSGSAAPWFSYPVTACCDADQQISLQHLFAGRHHAGYAGQFSRLVKAAAEKPPAMQRYRDHHINIAQSDAAAGRSDAPVTGDIKPVTIFKRKDQLA